LPTKFQNRGVSWESWAKAAAESYDGEAASTIWAEIREDARILEHGISPSNVALHPLWPRGVPSWARHAWELLWHTLVKSDESWEVWFKWYQTQLNGGPPSETLEVGRVVIADEFRGQGSRATNTAINRFGEELSAPKLLDLPKPLDNIPSVYGFQWTQAGTIALTSSSANWPVFPLPTSETDHRNRLNTCRTLAEDIIAALTAQKYQVRGEYADGLAKYASRLPDAPGSGNILLADAEARTLRNVFAADAQILSPGFASQLKTLLEQHIGLRPYYPEIANFYRDVQSGRLEAPLPQDAVDGFVNGLKDYTPTVFDASVGGAIEEVSQPAPIIRPPLSQDRWQPDPNQIAPPADPLHELDPKKARDFSVGGVVNRLWKIFLEGEKMPQAGEAWRQAGETLQPYVEPILEWLRSLPGS
jgi:hypothetical protein